MDIDDLKNPYFKLDSHTWDDHIASPMGDGEMESFQAELNSLAGVESDGSPRLKLVWAPDYEEWNVYLKRMTPPQWAFWRAIRDGNEPLTEDSPIIRPKYRYVAVPRYAILGRIPPESRWGDTRDRTFYEKGDRFFDEEGAPYEEGAISVEEIEQPIAWKKLLMIFTHSDQSIGNTPLCCLSMAHAEKKKCFGKFRKPDDLDLKFVEGKLALSRKIFAAAPHERLTVRDRLSLINGTAELYAAEEAAREKEADLISRQHDNDEWYKRPNDSVKGKFSIPGV